MVLAQNTMKFVISFRLWWKLKELRNSVRNDPKAKEYTDIALRCDSAGDEPLKMLEPLAPGAAAAKVGTPAG